MRKKPAQMIVKMVVWKPHNEMLTDGRTEDSQEETEGCV